MIEFFDEDNPRKRRSYSFTQVAAAVPQDGPHPFPPAKPDRSKANMTNSKAVSFTHQPSPPHAKSSHVIHESHQTIHLQKQKTESPVPLVIAQAPQQRSSGSAGQRQNQSNLEPQTISPSVSKENDDDQSDKGTYTIELENSNTEEEEARRMIDTVRIKEARFALFENLCSGRFVLKLSYCIIKGRVSKSNIKIKHCTT